MILCGLGKHDEVFRLAYGGVHEATRIEHSKTGVNKALSEILLECQIIASGQNVLANNITIGLYLRYSFLIQLRARLRCLRFWR